MHTEQATRKKPNESSKQPKRMSGAPTAKCYTSDSVVVVNQSATVKNTEPPRKESMKILGISKVRKGKQQESAIDLWRIYRPLTELQKHVDWDISFRPHVIKDFDKLEQKYLDDPDLFIKDHGETVVKELGEYDIIFTSYFTSPHVYTLLWAAEKHYGTKFIFDIDDDLYDVDPENPYWLAAGEAGAHFLTTMAQLTKHLCTTNDDLAKKLSRHSEVDPTVFVIPNYIPNQYPECTPQNGDKVVIGFFGGASHYCDIHETGILQAIEQIMHEHKNVHYHSAGQPIDHYLPKQRTKIIDVKQGTDWPTKLFPTLNYDIAIAPLRDTPFNKHKSNIKWQESTRMGAAFVGSHFGPYANLKPNTAITVPNTSEMWYLRLNELVVDENKRKELVTNARHELNNWQLENNWQKYKEMFEGVVDGL